MQQYIDCLKDDWNKLKTLPKPTVDQIKSRYSDTLEMYLYCLYDYHEFYNYKELKLLNRTINEKNDNLLLFVVAIGKLEILKYLISCGVDIDYKNVHKHNIYSYASMYNQVNILEYLNSICSDKNKADIFNYDAYYLAVAIGNIDVIKYFMKLESLKLKEYTIKHLYLSASLYSHVHILKYLENKVDIYVKNICGKNAYDVACSGIAFGHENAVKYFENKVLYLGYSKICSICYGEKDDKFIVCKNNHIVHLKCQQSINRHRCLACFTKYIL